MKIKRLLLNIKRRLYKNPRPALDGLDRVLEKYLNFRGGFFIEAGASDGYSQSNTYFLEKRLGWHGVLIEGIPELYEKCKKERIGSIVYNYALVSNDFPSPMVTMHFSGLMSVVDGALKIEEEEKKHIDLGIDCQYLDSSYSIDVPSRTLESILDKIKNLPEIDFFSLDVEGYELNVLKGLNLSKYRPKYILVEARFFEEVNAFFEEQGYEMIEKLSPDHYDYIYKTKNA